MFKLFKNHIIFLLAAVFCFGFALFPNQDALDISLHDTYYVVNHNHVFILFGGYFLICALAYLLLHKFKRKKIRFLYGTHLWTSIISFVIFIILIMNVGIQSAPKNYYDYSIYGEFDAKSTEQLSDINYYLSLFVIIFLIAQVIFLVNIGIGLLKRNS